MARAVFARLPSSMPLLLIATLQERYQILIPRCISRIRRTSDALIDLRNLLWRRLSSPSKTVALDLEKVDRTRFGVLVGSGIGGLKSLEDQHTVLMNKGASRVSPFMVPMMIVNMASGLISMEYGLEGPNFSIVTACATAANSIGEAWRMIRYGDADIFLAGGSEAVICGLGIAGFCSMRAMSTRNDEPEKASRPFDRDRDGFVMGEGAGILVLEEYEHAKARGAQIYCELAGYGLTSDAYHMTSPRPDGVTVARAMQLALDYAGANVTEVDYINAHATSTSVGDICETKAIKLLAGDYATKWPSSQFHQIDDRTLARWRRWSGKRRLHPGYQERSCSSDD